MRTQDTPTLLGQTLVLLRGDPRNLAELARDTGLGYFWLRKLRAGEIKNPGIMNVEKLFKALSPK